MKLKTTANMSLVLGIFCALTAQAGPFHQIAAPTMSMGGYNVNAPVSLSLQHPQSMLMPAANVLIQNPMMSAVSMPSPMLPAVPSSAKVSAPQNTAASKGTPDIEVLNQLGRELDADLKNGQLGAALERFDGMRQRPEETKADFVTAENIIGKYTLTIPKSAHPKDDIVKLTIQKGGRFIWQTKYSRDVGMWTLDNGIFVGISVEEGGTFLRSMGFRGISRDQFKKTSGAKVRVLSGWANRTYRNDTDYKMVEKRRLHKP